MMNTFDWLADLPLPSVDARFPIVEVSFSNGSRKGFYKYKDLDIITGDLVVVETQTGYDIGTVTLSGELVKLQMKKKRVKPNSRSIGKILRFPDESDIKKWEQVKSKEQVTLIRSRAIARNLKLDMKISSVEYQADGKKATFYFIADGRVDFRELIKAYAREFKVKIEMRQIGARQEASKIGGIGSCGRELCCSTWLSDFKSVTTSAARYQNLVINQSKLSGQCGKLKCCLNYELDTYLDALKDFPENAEVLKTQKGDALLQKTDILKKMMYYSYENSSVLIGLTVDKVKEILEANQKGEYPADLTQFIEVETPEEIDFTDVVGQVNLQSLEKKKSKKRKKKRKKRPGKDKS